MVKKKKGVARNVTLEADVDTVLLEYMKVQGITNVSRAVNDAIKYGQGFIKISLDDSGHPIVKRVNPENICVNFPDLSKLNKPSFGN